MFDSENTGASNDIVYSEFKYMLNSVIEQVQALTPQKKSPKVNLIGHSRGGITNLQYALDFPKNVDSLISIGTPYFGSQAAETAGRIITDTPSLGVRDGLDDIIDEQIYNSYYRTWTDGYETKYKNINSIAIGGVTTIDYQRDVLKATGGTYSDALSSLLFFYNNAVLQEISVAIMIKNYSKIVEQYPDLQMFSEEEFISLITLLTNEIHFGTWYSDVLVPVDSQQGFSEEKNYYFTKYVREFGSSGDSLTPKRAANNLSVIHNLEPYDAKIHSYILENIVMKVGDTIDTEISNVGKLENSDCVKWKIKIRNTHNEARTYVYNTKMCFKGDAENWTGLTNIECFRLEAGHTQIVEIETNGSATAIAVSSIYEGTRYIRYADKLWFHSDIRFADNIFKMTSYSNRVPYNSYEQNGIKVSIVGKNDTTWIIELTNNTGSTRSFDYNSRLCYESDAKNWTNLVNTLKTEVLANGENTYLKITENTTATSITISYSINSFRYVFYANALDSSGTMKSYANIKYYNDYDMYGMTVRLLRQMDSTWILSLTNNTGSGRNFEYDTKMCFEGDAKNWKGLSDVRELYLASGASQSIMISENWAATSIAISYMDGNYRKVFYANELNAESSTMAAYGNVIDTTQTSDSCLASGSLITLADGSKKAVEELTGDELLLVWNMKTGTFDSAPILFIDSEPIGHYEVISLEFSDGTVVKVISEHGFWDFDLNRYVYLDKDAEEYIGHWFNKQTENADGTYSWTKVQLVGVEMNEEITSAHSPVTYGHLCYYVNDMLSMPGGIDGLFNIFEIDEQTMTIDEEAFAEEVARYGMFTYDEFGAIFPIPEEAFEAFNGRYLKVAIGKELITEERIEKLIERYSEFLM